MYIAARFQPGDEEPPPPKSVFALPFLIFYITDPPLPKYILLFSTYFIPMSFARMSRDTTECHSKSLGPYLEAENRGVRAKAFVEMAAEKRRPSWVFSESPKSCDEIVFQIPSGRASPVFLAS